MIVALFAAAAALPSREPPLALWILAISVLAFFAAGTFCGYRAFSVRDWSIGIDPRQARLHADRDAGEQWALAGDVMVNSYHQNVEKLARKERWTQGTVALTTANAAVVSVAAIIATMPW